MKKFFLIFLIIMTVISQNDVYAADYYCYCKGNPESYYKLGNRLYFFQMCDHISAANGNIIRDFSAALGRSVGDREYYCRVIQYQGASSNDIFVKLARIIISTDNKISIYDDDTGKVKEYNYNAYDLYGESNNLYYNISAVQAPVLESESHQMIYTSGHHYDITLEKDEVYADKMHELAIYLCGGEDVTLPGGVVPVTPLPEYDLESPLQIKINSKDASMDMNVSKSGSNSDAVITPFKIWWHQSNIDLTDYKTEFYVREHGQYKKSLFSTWENISTGWVYSCEHITAKYCNNSLKWYEFNFRKDSNLYYAAKNNLGDDPFQVKFKTVDFMIRNKKEDAETGQMHYSNWVYLHVYEDGTYSLYELKEDYELDDSPEDTDNIDTDSPNYDEEIIYDDNTDYTPGIGGIGDTAKFIKVMKDLANSLGDFPDLFAQIFSFLPSWVLVCIGTLFVVIMLKGIF